MGIFRDRRGRCNEESTGILRASAGNMPVVLTSPAARLPDRHFPLAGTYAGRKGNARRQIGKAGAGNNALIPGSSPGVHATRPVGTYRDLVDGGGENNESVGAKPGLKTE